MAFFMRELPSLLMYLIKVEKLHQMKNLVLVIFVFALAASCKSKIETASAPMKPAETAPVAETKETPIRKMDPFQYLRFCMTGDFSSKEQSVTDSSYFDIRLRMVPIWKQMDNVFYLYVEQAMSTALDKPYRQRIYKVVREDKTHFTSYIYTIPEPERFVGKKEGDYAFSMIDQEIIIEKVGCEVKLEFIEAEDHFAGSTGENTCASEKSGASWATSNVTIKEFEMVSWDQGWDAQGKQVWGAVKGGYIFKKEH